MAVRLWDWLLHRVLGKHVADCSHSLGGGRVAVMHCAPAISRARESGGIYDTSGPAGKFLEESVCRIGARAP
jgi:hypothetical protein